MSPRDLHLHEELLLMTLRDTEGTVFGGTNYPFAIAGAILSELLMKRRVRVDEAGRRETVTVVDASTTGDPVLDEWLEAMGESGKGRSPADWIGRIASSRGLKDRVARQLVHRGILRVDEDKILWVFTRRIYPEVDPGPEDRLQARLETALDEDEDVDARTAILVALADQAGILKPFLGRDMVRDRKDRIAQIAEGERTAEAAAEALEAMRTALMITAAIPAIVTATIVTS